MLPDTDDHFLGEAILTVMFVFLFVWLTSPASPIQFPGRDTTWHDIVNHFTFILYLVVPIAILGIVESFYGAPKSETTTRFERYTEIIKAKSKTRVRTFTERQKEKTVKSKPEA